MIGSIAERVQEMKNDASNMISEALNETYTYLKPKYKDDDLETLKKQLLKLVNVKEHEFKSTEKETYTYEKIQEVLSTLNEKESIRKSKGVYYTPFDVVKFIIENTIKAVYGKLGANGLHVMDLNGIPYKSFCNTKRVLDPTSGAGEFLLAVLDIKFDLLDNHVDNVTPGMIKKIVSTIYGNDINSESTDISKIRLFLCVLKRYGIRNCASIEIILNENFTNQDAISNIPKFSSNFDMIIGNPPYVEDGKSELSPKKKYGNIYANELVNSAALLNDNGAMGFIIPLSYVSTPRMKEVRNDLFSTLSEQYILSYSDRPDCLFKSVHQKLCILIAKKRKCEKKVFTGNYQYWYREERDALFDGTVAVKNQFFSDDYIPKLGTPEDVSIYRKIIKGNNRKQLAQMPDGGKNCVYINMRATFWIKAFRQLHDGSEYKKFGFNSCEIADYFSCLVNSSLFWWYWICVSDCWHITSKELKGFFAPTIDDYTLPVTLAQALESQLENTKEYVHTAQTEYEYKHKNCIDQIHAIDDYVNGLYGLTPEESLYIKNFAYRYRISGGAQ